MVYSTRRFVLCLTLCYFVLVFFSPFNIAITSLGEERANLSAFCTFVRFVLVWFCLFPLPLDVWEGLRFVMWPSLDFSLNFLRVYVQNLKNVIIASEWPLTKKPYPVSVFVHFIQFFGYHKPRKMKPTGKRLRT